MRTSRLVPVLVVLLVVSIISGLAVAHGQDQTTRVPDLLLPWADVYSTIGSPMALTISLSSVDLSQFQRPTTAPAPDSVAQEYSDSSDPSTDTITIHWQPETNSSVDWTIDLFENYTTVADRVIFVGTTSIDSDGNPMNTGPFPFTARNVQNMWIRITITTRPAPHYPTAAELDTLRDPHHPVNVRLSNLEDTLVGPWGVTFELTVVIVVLALVVVAIIVLAVLIVFILRHQGA